MPRGSADTKRADNPDSAELKALAQSYASWGIKKLYRIARKKDTPLAIQVTCIQELLNRGPGRPAQHVAIDASKNVTGLLATLGRDTPGLKNAVIEALDVASGDDDRSALLPDNPVKH